MSKSENFNKLIFILSSTYNLQPLPLGAPRHDYQRNMGAERPVFRIWHPKPCWRKTHPILGCILREHGFGSQIRNTGSSGRILLWQSCLGAPSGRGYRLLIPDHQKIDNMPFSRSLEQGQNWPLILETMKIGAPSIFWCSHTNTHYLALFYIIILDWPQNMVSKRLELRSKYAYLCVRETIIYA